MVRFDAYSATTEAVNHYQLAELFAIPGQDITHRDGPGFHTFAHRVSFHESDTNAQIGAIQWGGPRQDGRVMLEVKGESSPKVVERLRKLCPHRVTRVDACADFDAPGAFERLLRAHHAVKREHRLWGEKRGDWEDHPDKGRTFYLGANSSPTRERMYEKGKQPEYAHLGKPDWVRVELQVRPAKQAKHNFAQLAPLEVWGASKWSRDLAAKVLREHVDPHPAGTVYRKSDLDRRVDALCKQYGPTLFELFDQVGSWECVGLTIQEKLKERQESALKRR
jgi:DNA relaxase NicK